MHVKQTVSLEHVAQVLGQPTHRAVELFNQKPSLHVVQLKLSVPASSQTAQFQVLSLHVTQLPLLA